MSYRVRRKANLPRYNAGDTGTVQPGQVVLVDHATFLRLVRDQPGGFDFLDDLNLANPSDEPEPGWSAVSDADATQALQDLPGIGEVLSSKLVEAGVRTPGALRDPANRAVVQEVVPEHILTPLLEGS